MTSIRSQSSTTSQRPPSEILNVNEPLYQVRLLAALRSGDPSRIHPFLAEIIKDRQKPSSENNAVDVGAAALHLAIRCATVQTVSLLLSHKSISPNGVHPPGSGTTPLHLAASIGRIDILTLLLEQEQIDDTLRDAQGYTCKEVAKDKAVARVIEDSRAFLNATYRSHLRSYILSPTNSPATEPLYAMLESPRSRHINLSYLDDASGSSLLHEAVKRKDQRMIKLAVNAGCDLFVRDRKGKTATDIAPKDDKFRVFLRQFTNQDTTLMDTGSLGPPSLKGYLNKYTNVARGYNTRWFVLQGGVLSYYRHQDDETVASRGSISMRTAVIKVSSNEKTRFEVHSTPSRGHSSIQKWFVKANHPVEAARWIQAIERSIEWHKRAASTNASTTSQSSISERERDSNSTNIERQSMESDFRPPSIHRSITSLQRTGTMMDGGSGSSIRFSHQSIPFGRGSIGGDYAGSVMVVDEPPLVAPPLNRMNSERSEGVGEDTDSGSVNEIQGVAPPHEGSFSLQGNALGTQIDLVAQLVNDSSSPPELKEVMSSARNLVHEYISMAKERDEWWASSLKHEQKRQMIWEESLQTVVKEGEALERELKERSRKRGSRFFAAGANGGAEASESGMSTLRRPPTIALSVPVEEESAHEDGAAAAGGSGDSDTNGSKANDYFDQSVIATAIVDTPTPTAAGMQVLTPRPRKSQQSFISPPASAAIIPIDDGGDTDEEDEFFDAVEAENLPNLIVNESLNRHSKELAPNVIDRAPYVGYRKLRTRLAMDADNRPATSLWQVLKGSIGKDLTKISFPVYFNEPTSMLQRMAEDMEFSECLDAAAREEDPLRRIGFVAAFAMSNYSSTIGRIAKPFNPMLSETFEYVSIEKEYRYVSEQVSHHPPISACWAESPSWLYYGEVDAQNKFMGKSFEIRPTGVAHAELILPEDWEPDYPKATGALHTGKVKEHYSWKKVTTNVSGFILGSPTIDHYGDMIITNHRTGDTCTLTFKPRGWRGRDAYEISGIVRDGRGRSVYEIAGRWNSRLIARAVGAGSGFLHPDAEIGRGEGARSPSPTTQQEYILLWQNSEKPPAPFNLTPFAITLNDCPQDTLRPYLPHTDCRNRPDQRAFELGQYELANDLKMRQEEKQRARRKEREMGQRPPHSPRWFTAVTDADTGERLWEPSKTEDGELEYWVERGKVWHAKQTSGGSETSAAAWKDVEDIFIDEPKELTALL